MLKEAIELLKEALNCWAAEAGSDGMHGTSPIEIKTKQLIAKAEHYKPTIYLEIRGGVLTNVYATEQMVVSLFDWDNYQEDPEYADKIDIDSDEWEHMIDSGINSGQLVSLSIE